MNRSVTVGLIGIGLLGSALAERILAAGFSMVGFDLSEKSIQEFSEQGGTPAASAQEVIELASRTIICLPNSKISSELLSSLEPTLQPNDLLIDVTTGHPEEMALMGERLRQLQVCYLDATVGGSSQQVRDKSAIVMIGGAKADADRAKDLFDTFTKQQFHVGPCGAGAQMKLITNLVLGLNRAVLAEGLSFAEQNGFELAQVLEVLKAGPGYSLVMETKGEKMINQQYAPQARLAQHLKDVRLILDVGKKLNTPLPLSAVHENLLETAETKGFGSSDNSAVFEAYRQSPSERPTDS